MWWQALVWIGVCAAGRAGGLGTLGRRNAKRVGLEDLPLFAGISLAFGVFCFFFFLVIAKLPTQPWYWLPPVALAAVCADAALAKWLMKLPRLGDGVAALMVCVPLFTLRQDAGQRQTNIDLIAATCGRRPSRRFHCGLSMVFGVTFNRYYKGERRGRPFLRWLTLAFTATICSRRSLPLPPHSTRTGQDGANARLW